MSIRYRIRLKPQGAYFFGGEHTFGKDDARKEGSRYSAVSTHFPQQSAVLGMLRKTLLIQNDALKMHCHGEWVNSKDIDRYKKALRVAGKDSFSYEKESDLGGIENISPIFITKDGVDYITNAKDADYKPKELQSSMMLNNRKQSTLIFENYNAKEYKQDHLISNDGTKLVYDDLFQISQSVGIKKTQGKESNEDSFFQKSAFLLKGDASFSFFLELEEDIALENTYVTLGADQSPFILEVKKVEKQNFEDIFQNCFKAKSFDRIILHSETLITQEIEDKSLFIFGKRSTYRQLKNKKGEKSKRYFLLDRGSVLYTNDLENSVAFLSQPHLQRVGINKFTPIKGN